MLQLSTFCDDQWTLVVLPRRTSEGMTRKVEDCSGVACASAWWVSRGIVLRRPLAEACRCHTIGIEGVDEAVRIVVRRIRALSGWWRKDGKGFRSHEIFSGTDGCRLSRIRDPLSIRRITSVVAQEGVGIAKVRTVISYC